MWKLGAGSGWSLTAERLRTGGGGCGGGASATIDDAAVVWKLGAGSGWSLTESLLPPALARLARLSRLATRFGEGAKS